MRVQPGAGRDLERAIELGVKCRLPSGLGGRPGLAKVIKRDLGVGGQLPLPGRTAVTEALNYLLTIVPDFLFRQLLENQAPLKKATEISIVIDYRNKVAASTPENSQGLLLCDMASFLEDPVILPEFLSTHGVVEESSGQPSRMLIPR